MSNLISENSPFTAPKPGTRLVLRADGNPTIGLGHLMRLLALADILHRQFAETVFALRAPSESFTALLAAKGLLLQELPEQPLPTEADWLRRHFLRPTDTVVLDGYGFDYNYQCTMRAGVHRLVCLDDLHTFPFAADLVLNPAGGVLATAYELRQPGARLLAGPRFAPLQAAFSGQNNSPPEISAATVGAATEAATPARPDTILVCLGGADPRQLTRQVAAQLLRLPESAVWQVHVVVGAAYAGWNQLAEWAASQPRLALHRALSAAALAALMRQCGAAVLSPSTVSYEYCAAGGGLLLTLLTADNQHDLDHFLRSAGLALPYLSAPNVLTGSEANRTAAQLRAAQRRHFDGLAPVRIRQAFAAMQLPQPPFQLRPVTASDSDLLLTWTNDPTVRQQSFNPKPVPRAAHEAWFSTRLADAEALLLLAENVATGAPVGLIRFQVEAQTATLSYQLAAEWRGLGLAAPLLLAGTAAVQKQYPQVRRVRGQVQATNLASGRAFERAGFSRETTAADAPVGSLTFGWIV